MQIPKTLELKTSKFYRISKFYFKAPKHHYPELQNQTQPFKFNKFIYNIPNKNLPFSRLEELHCRFDFSPKNRGALKALKKKKKKVALRN